MTTALCNLPNFGIDFTAFIYYNFNVKKSKLISFAYLSNRNSSGTFIPEQKKGRSEA